MVMDLNKEKLAVDRIRLLWIRIGGSLMPIYMGASDSSKYRGEIFCECSVRPQKIKDRKRIGKENKSPEQNQVSGG